ncbi:MAG: hypothetical protein IT530_12215 [Burkholderiales bacterium]|nr:hypothetical protein [Burkholderiales bacterium]
MRSEYERASARCVRGAGGRALHRAVLPLTLALALGACAQTQTKPGTSAPPANLSGYSAAFKDGFKDGCNTARGSGRRDDLRASVDGQYAQGWQDGNAICGKR